MAEGSRATIEQCTLTLIGALTVAVDTEIIVRTTEALSMISFRGFWEAYENSRTPTYD